MRYTYLRGAISSAVERLVYTERVGGSIPSSPTISSKTKSKKVSLSKHIHLIDGSGFIYRAFYGLPPLQRSDGLFVGAVYGFCSLLMQYLIDQKISHCAVVFDSKRGNFRHDLYPDYKKNRASPPDELIPQFSLIRDVCTALDLPTVELEGFEADDLIATYCALADKESQKATIVSCDKDFFQLLSSSISIFDPMKAKYISTEDVIAKFGVGPAQVADVQALMGDTTDNIPGISGVGPKTASALILEHESLEGLMTSVHSISKPKLREQLLNGLEQLPIYKQLVTLRTDIPLELNWNDFEVSSFDSQKISAFLEEFEFSRLKNKASLLVQTYSTQKTHTRHETFLQEQIKDSVTLFWDKDALWAAWSESDYAEISSNQALELWNSLTPKIVYNLHDLLRDHPELAWNNSIDDLQLMLYVNRMGEQDESFEAFLKRNGIVSFSPEHTCLLYSEAKNAKADLKRDNLWTIYESLHKPLVPCVLAMERTGVCIDKEQLHVMRSEFLTSQKTLEECVFKTANTQFNIGSPKQVSEILFQTLDLPHKNKGKPGKTMGTDSSVLEDLVLKGYTVAGDILEWRKYAKLISTYTDPLEKKIQNGRIHTHYHIADTATGRFSSTDPNLQNIPIRTKEGRLIRRAFVASPGHKLVSLDYSQVELRILAHMAGASRLQAAFSDNQDVHAVTAASILGIPLNEVTSDQRRQAKIVNFSIIYGVGAPKLAHQLGFSVKEAEDYIARFFELNPEINGFLKETIHQSKTRGFVTTLMGARCYIPNANSQNFMLRQYAERQAMNAPIQGSSAEIIKLAMIRIFEQRQSLSAKMLLQVHDELLFEIPEAFVDTETETLKKQMESVINLSIPLSVDASVGDNWAEL